VVGESLAVLSAIGWATGLLLLLIAGLVILRSRLARHVAAEGGPATWGCGYALPSARMQYTGSSFVSALALSFGHLIRPVRKLSLPAGHVPGSARLETHAPDFALQRIYAPLFSGATWLFERFWPFQRGRIQLYLVYIVVTLIVLFALEGWLSPFARAGPIESSAHVIRGSDG
jgi:hypothetical protein